MNLTKNMEDQALKALQEGRPSALPGKVRIPLQIMSTTEEIFVAEAGDEEIFPLGVVKHDGKEYQVGPIREK